MCHTQELEEQLDGEGGSDVEIDTLDELCPIRTPQHVADPFDDIVRTPPDDDAPHTPGDGEVITADDEWDQLAQEAVFQEYESLIDFPDDADCD